MIPTLRGIDHIHIYAADRAKAERWYELVLGFKRNDELSAANGNEPLVLVNADCSVSLALFERARHDGSSAIAFGVSGQDFLDWAAHLEDKGVKLRVTDHDSAYSMYFSDLDDNLHEITTDDRDYVAGRLA